MPVYGIGMGLPFSGVFASAVSPGEIIQQLSGGTLAGFTFIDTRDVVNPEPDLTKKSYHQTVLTNRMDSSIPWDLVDEIDLTMRWTITGLRWIAGGFGGNIDTGAGCIFSNGGKIAFRTDVATVSVQTVALFNDGEWHDIHIKAGIITVDGNVEATEAATNHQHALNFMLGARNAGASYQYGQFDVSYMLLKTSNEIIGEYTFANGNGTRIEDKSKSSRLYNVYDLAIVKDDPGDNDPVWVVDDEIIAHNHQNGFSLYNDDSLVSICRHYDNRVIPVSVTVDDYSLYNITEFNQAFDLATTYDLVTSVASYADPALLDQTAIDNLQSYMDQLEVTACSHGLDETHFITLTEEDIPFLEQTVSESKAILEGALALPLSNRYNGSQVLSGWIQSYGTANEPFQPIIDAFCSEYGYLTDAMVGNTANSINPTSDWDSQIDGMFNRLKRYSFQVADHALADAKLDIALANGTPYNMLSHPKQLTAPDWVELEAHYAYIAGKDDIWSVGIDQQYLYRYLSAVAPPTISVVEDTGFFEVEITADGLEREKYGLSYPITYRCELPVAMQGAATINVQYKEEGGSYASMTEKLSTDIFNGIDAFRRDGDTIYVSQSLPQTKNKMFLKLESI